MFVETNMVVKTGVQTVFVETNKNNFFVICSSDLSVYLNNACIRRMNYMVQYTLV